MKEWRWRLENFEGGNKMKTLLISDIHGNYEALKTILKKENYDQIYCMGDIVDYGPSNQECIESIRKEADLVIKGNHDNAVAHGVDCGCGYELKELSQEVRKKTVKELGERSKRFLAELPITLKENDCFLVHASIDDLFKYLKPDTPEKQFTEFKEIDEDLIILGHTHIQMDRTIFGKRFINPGSLGQPRDGDPKAAYAVLKNGEIEFKRQEYDIEKVIEKMKEKDYPERAMRILQKGKVVP